MAALTMGILHPGAMGISLAASALKSGLRVFWVSDSRSQETRTRAERFDLEDAGTLENLCASCTIIVSVCPPHAADDVAAAVLRHSFRGLYLEANAISPQKSTRIGSSMQAAGVEYVDGGIIGGPAWEPGSTWLYLSGEGAESVRACFASGPIKVDILGEEIGRASALKMCYAAYTKGTTALLAAILSTAETLGVREDLEDQWDRDEAGFAERTGARVRRVSAKAWRFAGEMDEIAATLREARLPDGFHLSAGEIYRRIAHFKDERDPPPLEEILQALSRPG